MSQEELAHRAGVSRTYLGLLEARGKNVTIELLARLAEALDVEAAELLMPGDPATPPP